MILPGLSGGYLLLVLGAYIPILSGIEAVKDLKAGDINALMILELGVVVRVLIGVVLGVVGVSNVLKWALDKYEQSTLAFFSGFYQLSLDFGRFTAVVPGIGMIIKGKA